MRRIFNKMKERNELGFTIAELLVTILIMGIIAGIAVPIYITQRDNISQSLASSSLELYAQQISQKRIGNNNQYPAFAPSIDDLSSNIKSINSYTLSKDRKEYCAKLTLKNNNVQYVKGNADGSFTRSSAECSVNTTDPNKTALILSGEVGKDNKVKLRWNSLAPKSSAIYKVYMNNAQVASVTVNANMQTGAYTLPTSIEQSAKFYVEHNSTKSNVIDLTPVGIKPYETPNLGLKNVKTSTEMKTGTVYWEPQKYARTYELYNAETNALVWSGDTNSHETSISAASGKHVKVYLVAKNSFGSSPRSNIIELAGPVVGQPIVTYQEHGHSATGYKVSMTWAKVVGASRYDLFINDTLVKSAVSSGETLTFGWNTGNKTIKLIPYNPTNDPGPQSTPQTFLTDQAIPDPMQITLNNAGGPGKTIRFNIPAPTKYTNGYKYRVSYFSNTQNKAILITEGILPKSATYADISTTFYHGDRWYIEFAPYGWMGTASWRALQGSYAQPNPSFSGAGSNQGKAWISATCQAGNTLTMSGKYFDSNNPTAKVNASLTQSGAQYTHTSTPNYNGQRSVEFSASCKNNRGSNISSSNSYTVAYAWRTIATPTAPTLSMKANGVKNTSGHGTTTTISGNVCPAGTVQVYTLMYRKLGVNQSTEVIHNAASGTVRSSTAPTSTTWAYKALSQSKCGAGTRTGDNYQNQSAMSAWRETQIVYPIPTAEDYINLSKSKGVTSKGNGVAKWRNNNKLGWDFAYKDPSTNGCVYDTAPVARVSARNGAGGSGYSVVKKYWWATMAQLNGEFVYTDKQDKERFALLVRCRVRSSGEDGAYQNYYIYPAGGEMKNT